MNKNYPDEKIAKWKTRAAMAALKMKKKRLNGAASLSKRQKQGMEPVLTQENDSCYFCKAW